MPSATLTTIANSAAQYLGVLDSGEALSTQQVADALAAMNNLIDQWGTDALMVYSEVRSVQTLVAATQSYTIGTGQAFNVPRPAAIAAAALINAAGPGNEVEVCSARRWAELPDRQSQSYAVRHLFYDRGYPTGNIFVSPVPLGSGLTLELLSYSPLTSFPDTSTSETIPAGYLRLMELGLAIELAPQYDMTVSPALQRNYNDAIARVRNLNAQMLGVEPPAGQVAAFAESSSAQIKPATGPMQPTAQQMKEAA
jgi:hypothetical protein